MWCADGRGRSRLTTVLVVVLVGLLASGCLNATVSLSIDEEDRVSGQALIAVPPSADDRVRLRVPDELSERVRITPYRKEGQRGSKVEFDRLDFDELERLARELNNTNSRYSLSVSRSGSLVNVDGSVDLTPLADTSSEVLVEISTPGEVTTTNGKVDAGVVSWEPAPGEVTEMSATFQFSDGRSAGLFGWSTVVGALTFGVAVLVGLMALLAHQHHRNETQRR
ncbi:DUF3153 domain-containing protein [Actinopolyspora mortivallis]|uniref:DUF3153 domain-containing protein n=1 Tax=Actinopolyspora mortivallis TaxID=33906 RepID=UPI0003A92089|nr:DUF3153 domain-containing protein [Actinopolyspora mortivallis]